MTMKEDEIYKALWRYYGVVIEERRYAEAQKFRFLNSSIMYMALFLTFMGLVMTQTGKIVFSSNWITIGIVFIGIILFLFFISFIAYFLSMRVYNHELLVAAMVIEKLQQDILSGIISLEELQERFENIYPFLNASKYRIKRKTLFYPKRE